MNPFFSIGFLNGLPLLGLIKKVNPNLKNPNIKRILQIRALDEWRENFPITPIGEISEQTFSKEITVLGAHSDIGGGYWQSSKELSDQLHFFDLSINANTAEKQKLEGFKKELRDWYISKKLCKPEQIWWKTMHHVRKVISGQQTISEILLLEETFMGAETYKVINGISYSLVGYHYKLQSERPLSNKLSLVYMNVMKYMAIEYADVPFLKPEDENITPPLKHKEEYIYSKDKLINKKMKEYEDLIKQATEHEWINKEGKQILYPNIVKKEDGKNVYHIPQESYFLIKGNYVHLSANLNTPFNKLLDHHKFAYTNVPRFTDQEKYKDPPYERETYEPDLAPYDWD